MYVTRDQATASIEVFLEDVYLFQDLKPNASDVLEPAELTEGIEKHQQFIKERFQVRDADGKPVDSDEH